MLTIKTDIENKNWLIYIVEQFRQINLAKFNIEIIGINNKEQYENILYYTIENNNNVNLYNSKEVKPNGNIEYIRDDLYIIENTRNNLFKLNYDILWNAFVFLSRYEEYLFESSGKLIYSYSSKHPRKDKSSFLIPIVNILFNELELFINDNFPALKFGDKNKPIIDLSHDVDYIKKTIQLRLKQTAFNVYNTIKSITKPKIFFRNLIKTLNFAFSNCSYSCFEYWQNLENKYKEKSTFYIYVKNGRKDFKSWLIDPSYDIKTNKELQDKLKELKKDGFEIGLHGSYYSANSLKRLKEEKKILEDILGFSIIKTRQHWLNYSEELTPHIHNDLFKYDSTLGWNDTIGFRSGCANKFKPYDFKNKQTFTYEVIPQVVMDSSIYEYTNDENIFKKAKDILQLSKQTSKNTYISISWHQRVCNKDYHWDKFYKEILIKGFNNGS